MLERFYAEAILKLELEFLKNDYNYIIIMMLWILNNDYDKFTVY